MRWGFAAAAAGCRRGAGCWSLAPARSGKEPAQRRDLGSLRGCRAGSGGDGAPGAGAAAPRALRGETVPRARPWRGERRGWSGAPGRRCRALSAGLGRGGSPGSRAHRGRRARGRGAGAGLMLLKPGSLGGGCALGAVRGEGGRSWQRAGEAVRPWQREGNVFQITPKHCLPRLLTVNLCTEVTFERKVSCEEGGWS